MQITAGTKLAHYEIRDLLGRGGMGEVWRATDSRLRRDVALKFLPDEFMQDPERLSRFDREAHVLASLNHPRVASIYGFEEVSGSRFLVIELAGGETLAERIARGRVPVIEAIDIGLQIAEAVEAAHEKGIIHRDLKPANVKLTREGEVKVLDFGLARALDTDESEPSLENSPTMIRAATGAGVILGTASYMSPEQARGRQVDRRADVWAFGVVMWEMLAGRQLFAGETVSDTLAEVLRTDPDWAALPSDAPPALLRVLRRCLEKNPKNRLHDIGDARLELLEARKELAEGVASPAPGAEAPVPRRYRVLPWAALAALAGAVAAFIITSRLRSPEERVQRFTLLTSREAPVSVGAVGGHAIFSPDGQHILYVGKTQLFLRSLGEFEAKPIAGTEGGYSPFFSPDGKWVAFFSTGKLRKVDLAGGGVRTICAAAGGRGGTWSSNGTIIYGTFPGDGLMQVSAAGGTPARLTKLDSKRGEVSHRLPQFLPGERQILFTVCQGQMTRPEELSVEIYDLDARKRIPLLTSAMCARYRSGHLFWATPPRSSWFTGTGTLMSAPFDPEARKITGNAIPVVEQLHAVRVFGSAEFDVSSSGDTLLYLEPVLPEVRYEWLSRTGDLTPLQMQPGPYEFASLSPDGKTLAISIIGTEGGDVWLQDLATGGRSRLTLGGSGGQPVWHPNARQLTYRTREGNLANISADGSEGETVVNWKDQAFPIPNAWTPDGSVLLFSVNSPATGMDLWIAKRGNPLSPPQPLIRGPGYQEDPVISPNGEWFVYASDDSGRDEVYLQRFGGPGERRQISLEGGSDPKWNPRRNEIVYRTPAELVIAELESGATVRVASRAPWPGTKELADAEIVDFSPDGERLLLARGARDLPTTREIHVVAGWQTELTGRQ